LIEESFCASTAVPAKVNNSEAAKRKVRMGHPRSA
jgi:hypothetical protein